MPNFTNPYKSEPKDAVMRTTFVLTTKDVSKLRAWEPKEGVIQTTLALLLKKLINELERNKLSPGDRFGYQFLVSDCRIELPTINNTPTRNAAPASTSGSTAPKPATRKQRSKSEQAAS